MKTPKPRHVLFYMILANLAIFIFFINKKSFWPQGKEHPSFNEAVEELVTVVIYDFEHFENDVINTVKSFLSIHPALKIVIVSDDLPYPPLHLPNGNVKLVVLNVPVNQAGDQGRPDRFIETKYTIFIPDGFHLKDSNGLKRLILHLNKNKRRVQMISTAAESQRAHSPTCDQLKFDYKRWTLSYSNSKKPFQCDSVGGKAALLIETSYLFKLNTVFIRPFQKALFIQSVLRKWKVRLLLGNSPFFEKRNLFQSEHNRLKHEKYRKQHEESLFRKYGIKKVEHKDGSMTWLGCSKETARCFGTIINDVPSFIYSGKWTPPCCLSNLRETTRHVLRIFENLRVSYWLEGGSLLGAARHGDVIPWDYDVDIGMFRNDIEKIPNLMRAKQGNRFTDDKGFVWEKSREGDFYRVQFSQINHMHIDIFPFYEKDGVMTKDTWFKTHRQDTEFPVRFLQPLGRLNFMGMNVMVPNNYKEFLEYKFGKGVIRSPKYPNGQIIEK